MNHESTPAVLGLSDGLGPNAADSAPLSSLRGMARGATIERCQWCGNCTRKPCRCPAEVEIERLRAALIESPLAGPNIRRMVRAARLCEELGHGGDTLAALQHMKRMESALKVLHTWAAFPPLDVRDVRALCNRALNPDEAAYRSS